MFRFLGFEGSDLGDGRTGMVMVDLIVNFKDEASMFYELVIDSHLGEIEKINFRVFQRIAKAPNTIIALAESGIVAFDTIEQKTVPLPETFLRSLGEKKSG